MWTVVPKRIWMLRKIIIIKRSCCYYEVIKSTTNLYKNCFKITLKSYLNGDCELMIDFGSLSTLDEAEDKSSGPSPTDEDSEDSE